MTAVTGLIYAANSDFSAGEDWAILIVAPNVGNAEISFNNGGSWSTVSTYNAGLGAYEYRCSGWGSSGCALFDTDGEGVVLARKVGESTSLKAIIGGESQNPSGATYKYTYAAYCMGTDITLQVAAQYASPSSNNYFLSQSDTAKLRLSVAGGTVDAIGQFKDGGFLGTDHWWQVFEPVTVATSAFPVNFTLSDNTSVVSPWSRSVSTADFQEPCTNASNPSTTTSSSSSSSSSSSIPPTTSTSTTTPPTTSSSSSSSSTTSSSSSSSSTTSSSSSSSSTTSSSSSSSSSSTSSTSSSVPPTTLDCAGFSITYVGALAYADEPILVDVSVCSPLNTCDDGAISYDIDAENIINASASLNDTILSIQALYDSNVPLKGVVFVRKLCVTDSQTTVIAVCAYRFSQIPIPQEADSLDVCRPAITNIGTIQHDTATRQTLIGCGINCTGTTSWEIVDTVNVTASLDGSTVVLKGQGIYGALVDGAVLVAKKCDGYITGYCLYKFKVNRAAGGVCC